MARVRQIRDVILERLEEQRAERIDLQQRSTAALLQALTGQQDGQGWEMYPARRTRELPSTEAVTQLIGPTAGQQVIPWEQIVAMAEARKEG